MRLNRANGRGQTGALAHHFARASYEVHCVAAPSSTEYFCRLASPPPHT